MDKTKKTTIRIEGMHCPSCDILVKTKVSELPHILNVDTDFVKQEAEVTYTGTLSLHDVNAVLCSYGYTATSIEDVTVTKHENITKKTTEILLVGLILGIVYYLARELHIIPDTAVFGSNISLTTAFFIGLVASASTCMATTGVLFANLSARSRTRLRPLVFGVFFMLGRLAAYAFFGYILGFFGKQLLALSIAGVWMSIAISIIFILLGLDMLGVVPLARFFARLPGKKLATALIDKKGTVPILFAVLAGIGTYFLPCGFSYTLQVYAFSLGDPRQSALIMFAFALGTLPALFAISLLMRIAHHKIYQYIVIGIALVTIALGISYLANVAKLYGYAIPLLESRSAVAVPVVPIVNGKQQVKMIARNGGYYPSYFTVKRDIPVRWEIDGQEIYGCQGALQAPKAGIPQLTLKEGENIVEFTPHEAGPIHFSCSMGMFSGTFEVL